MADRVRLLEHSADADHKGYLVLDVDHERVQAKWYYEKDVTHGGPQESLAAALATARGSHRLSATTGPS